ncbi:MULTISPECIES: class II aldolase/adducin family protein [Mesorhizobium]|uniref:Class II aldolase n=1 Tax=Mesorhizobium denitrificans TaxID=2294114 RepID=A0A371XD77_9HYPH|nr:MULTISPECIES: class II aldolase/adducin family protein [Mesorhizobium]RFC67166.1 class II aldolase [Mesorhizobium denitrificans]
MSDWQTELDALRDLSARIGADPLLTQAAGGNTSLKAGDVLWIKASGTWLAHARDREIMVPVSMKPLIEAVRAFDPRADRAQEFVVAHLNPSGLRPSIETTVHALLPHRIVLHSHCVDTIAIAVRTDCEQVLRERLSGINWALVPYARPGLPLALAIDARLGGKPDVLVLANHGLVVGADTVAEAETLLREVKSRLATAPRATPAFDPAELEKLTIGADYRLPADPAAHAVALDPTATEIVRGGSLYPDHVIFLGRGTAITNAGESAEQVMSRLGTSPTSILFPSIGVLMRNNATESADAMARCLADVTLRIPAGAPVRYLSDEDHDQLTNWDAEKYRQQLDRAASAA